MTIETFRKAAVLQDKIEDLKRTRQSFETMVIDESGISIKGAFESDKFFVRISNSPIVDTILSMLIDDCDKQITELEKQFNDL